MGTYALGGVGEAGTNAGDTTGEDSSQAVGVEGSTEDRLDLVLEHDGDLISAQVGHGDGLQK
jgi:hypothetical protein